MIVASVFRNSTGYVDRYCAQVEALRAHTDVTVIAVEGDSDDETYKMLCDTDFFVFKAEHGGPMFPSIDDPRRWRQLAAVCNIAMIAATRLAAPDDVVCYVESDLIWAPETLLTLAEDLTRVPAVAPMSMIVEDGEERFYDGYGYRRNGRCFDYQAPYCDDWDSEALIPIDSSGSCFVTLGQYLPVINFSPVTCILAVGESLRENGIQLYLDPTVAVHHP